MLLQTLINRIEEEYPPALAYDWDNVGLLAGSPDREIKKVLVTLDVHSGVVAEAEKCGADLILSHHPILMNGTKSVRSDRETGRMLETLFKNNICVYAAHTNLDTAKHGINAYLAELFQLEQTEIIEPNGPDTGLGRIGNLAEPVPLSAFAQRTKALLKTPGLRFSGDPARQIRRVAIGSGGCGELIPTARMMGADVLVTADLKYHQCIDAVLNGIAVIDAGHYPTEIVVQELFTKLLRPYGLEVVASGNPDIFQYI